MARNMTDMEQGDPVKVCMLVQEKANVRDTRSKKCIVGICSLVNSFPEKMRSPLLEVSSKKIRSVPICGMFVYAVTIGC